MAWLLNQIVVGKERGLQGANGVQGRVAACLMPAACRSRAVCCLYCACHSLAGRPSLTAAAC